MRHSTALVTALPERPRKGDQDPDVGKHSNDALRSSNAEDLLVWPIPQNEALIARLELRIDEAKRVWAITQDGSAGYQRQGVPPGLNPSGYSARTKVSTRGESLDNGLTDPTLNIRGPVGRDPHRKADPDDKDRNGKDEGPQMEVTSTQHEHNNDTDCRADPCSPRKGGKQTEK